MAGAKRTSAQVQRQRQGCQRDGEGTRLLLLPVARKQAFSCANLGEALCKRLRPARQALLARIHDDASAVGSSVSRHAVAGAVGRSPSSGADYAFKQMLTGGRYSLDKLVRPSPMQPDDLCRDLFRPLPPRPTRRLSLPTAPRPGPRLLWDLSPCTEPVPRNAVAEVEERSHPLSYMEYLSWLQEVLPEDMHPEVPQVDEDAEEQPRLTALELLRRISVAACPPSPEPEPETRVPPLTDEEREAAEQILGDGNPNEVMVSKFNVDITRDKMRCLRPGQWLNDEVINFYFKLLQERGKLLQGAPKCWFPNSFFWPKLSGNNSSYSYKEVKRWTIKAKIDIFELDLICFPMNIGESHWAMGVIDLTSHGFRYFDSMFCRPHKNFVPFLRKYVQDEHKAKKGKALDGVEDWELILHEKPVPQQENGYDCGVFTCMFGDYVSAGRELVFEQADMPSLRMRLAARVVAADENF